jgi:hypothetical protein
MGQIEETDRLKSSKELHFPLFLQTGWINDWLIIYCFTSRSRIFHFYGDVTITGKGLQNLGLCSALRAFEQGRIFKYRTTPAVTRGLSFSGLIRRTAPFHRLLRHTRGCRESILTQILKQETNSRRSIHTRRRIKLYRLIVFIILFSSFYICLWYYHTVFENSMIKRYLCIVLVSSKVLSTYFFNIYFLNNCSTHNVFKIWIVYVYTVYR